MKELNHLKEVNQVYDAVDAELWGGNDSVSNASDMSFISTLKKPMTPMRWNNSPALSSTMKKGGFSRTVEISPSVRSLRNLKMSTS